MELIGFAGEERRSVGATDLNMPYRYGPDSMGVAHHVPDPVLADARGLALEDGGSRP
jgi:hypothetical protein